MMQSTVRRFEPYLSINVQVDESGMFTREEAEKLADQLADIADDIRRGLNSNGIE